jgi:hypothetical protein
LKKWYDEEYEWEIEVIRFSTVIAQRDTVGTVRKSEISIPAPMAVL